MSKLETPGYVELFAAVGVYYIAKVVFETAAEMSGVFHTPLNDLVGYIGGAGTMLGYIALRNRGVL